MVLILQAVATYIGKMLQISVTKHAAYFSADVADFAGWNKRDTVECADALNSMHEGEFYKCGNYTISAYTPSDDNYFIIIVVED